MSVKITFEELEKVDVKEIRKLIDEELHGNCATPIVRSEKPNTREWP